MFYAQYRVNFIKLDKIWHEIYNFMYSKNKSKLIESEYKIKTLIAVA